MRDAKRGRYVFPLKPRDEVPLTAHGFKDATCDPATVAAWWATTPDANIGLVPSLSGLVVISARGPEGAKSAQAAGLMNERTLTVTTGREEDGFDYYYHLPLPAGAAVTASDIGSGTTVHYDKDFVVLPPSIDPTGARYTWSFDVITELPPKAVALLCRQQEAPQKPTNAAASLPERIPEGQRNDQLTSPAGSLRHCGATASEDQPPAAPAPADLVDSMSTAEVLDVLDTAAPQAAAEARAKREAREANVPGAPSPKPFPVVRVLEGDAPEPPSVLVDDLVVDRDVNVWVGPGGAAKTVTALVLAVCVALGRAIFDTLKVQRPGPVLLVSPEDGQAAVRMMLDAIIEGMALDATDRATLAERLVMIPDDALVNLATDTGQLRRTAQAHGAVLVVLDPLRNLLGGADENDNAIAGACLDALRRDVCRAAGAAVLMNTHTRKPGKDMASDALPTMYEARGASAWVAGARLVFGVANKAGHVTLTALKANRLRSDLHHELRLTIEADPTMKTRWLSCTLVDANAGARSESLTPGVGRELNVNEKAALACLDDTNELGLRVTWSRWRDESGLKADTFRSVKDRILDAGLAQAILTGKKTRTGSPEHVYAITDGGRSALRFGWVRERPNCETVSEL